MKILWYVSSHGWGHAARQRELIRIYKQKHPDTIITVASDVPKWFWDNTEINSIIPGVVSPIVKEKDDDIDLEATRTHFQNFIGQSSALLKQEVTRQNTLKPDLIITDIDPLPVKAANLNHIPALGISNFTWDWILKEMFPDMLMEVSTITEMYSSGTFLKLPLSPNYSPFKTTIEAPLLRGGKIGNPSKVKKLLPAGKICLLALRQKIEGMKLRLPEGYTAVSCLPEPAHLNCFNITPSELSQNGATFSDLFAASNILLTKPGYGIVSQIITTGKKAILLTGRNFPEEKFLLPPLQNKKNVILLNMRDHSKIQKAVTKLMLINPNLLDEKYSEDNFLTFFEEIINKL